MDTTNSTNSSSAGTAPGTDTPKPYLNPTSRLHRYVCACDSHIINEQTGATRPGPYIMRVAGTGLLATCFYCGEFFRLEDEAPRRKLYRGCRHCSNPDEHTHGAIAEDGTLINPDDSSNGQQQ